VDAVEDRTRDHSRLSCGATSGSQWLHELKHDGFRIRVTWTSCERLPARFPDPHARNVGLSNAGDHALALGGRESGLEQVEQHVDREAVFRNPGRVAPRNSALDVS
jgi:hypothetical protein